MSWVDIAVGAGGGATAIMFGGGFLVSQLKHVIRRVVATEVLSEIKEIKKEVTSEIKTVKDDLAAVHLRLVKETGGNSNGLRQKVNEIGQDLNQVGKDVAHLKGAFEQHTHTTA